MYTGTKLSESTYTKAWWMVINKQKLVTLINFNLMFK
jgi:hypothetical protein